jgi:hypothetical protein
MAGNQGPVGYIKQAQRTLVTLAVGGICIRILWWEVAPLLPLVITGIVILAILGLLIFRTSKF